VRSQLSSGTRCICKSVEAKLVENFPHPRGCVSLEDQRLALPHALFLPRLSPDKHMSYG
jgi:hypothetical protein